MRTAHKISNTNTASRSLLKKLTFCGTKTKGGYWNWCRSPACDRCRRYRARMMAEMVTSWATTVYGERLRKFRVGTLTCYTPSELITEIDRCRRSIRQMCDRRQRQDNRWGRVRVVGYWYPRVDAGRWSATLQGVLELGVHEVTVLDAIEPLMPSVKLTSFPLPLIWNDLHAWIHYAIDNVRGLETCSDYDLTAWFNELDRTGGFKPLMFRRGFQQ